MIVAVTGGKGGVGKSTVAHNLGYELDAVVIDGDLAKADLPSGRGPDLHDVLAGRADPMDAVQRLGAVRMLPCGDTLEGAFAADMARFPEAVERVARECGTVVIDCPAGLARDVGVQLDCADVAVLVTTPDRTALLNAYRTKEVALEFDTPVASAVLNRAASGGDAGPDASGETATPFTRASDTLERVLQRDEGTEPRENGTSDIEDRLAAPTTVIEERPAVAASQARGRPLGEFEPTNPAVEAFARLARTVEHAGRRQRTVPDAG